MQSSLLLFFLLINIVAGYYGCPTFEQIKDIRMKLKDNVKWCRKGQSLTIDETYLAGVDYNYLSMINDSCPKYKQLVNWASKIDGHIEDLYYYDCFEDSRKYIVEDTL